MTVSDALAAAEAAAEAAAAEETENRGAGARARVRARAMVTASNGQWLVRARNWVAEETSRWWWMPESLPTVTRAWADRHPPADRVPGGHKALHWAWLGWNHTIGLAVPAAAAVAVGAICAVAWMLSHPARGLLALAVFTIALVALS